jgi:HPr kinase/phosphorylase
VKPVLEEQFAPSTTLHGSLADVFGVGLFFTGQSGIGKSECVLDLVERGHRLVADDLVITTRRGSDVLIGRGHELQRHYMEIRGIGLIDVPAIFGVRAVRQQKRMEVVVVLEAWDQEAVVDRTGLDGETREILGVSLPQIRVPLNPGKNITVIAEVIAMNHLLRYSGGVDPAEAFNQRLIGRMREQAAARSNGGTPAGVPGAPGGPRARELQRYLRDDDE